ncbi:hypothetical protein [bacterium endosymbiont of Bathymodiolus sp. 5 South]|jgi:hypothetical protein|uniref:hypothetical protein n=1 Tax=bacterium endosymbiont of Bathymodiolus sp. 5 South TaxID=1181670 RepID=UPI0010BA642B|nr:hypothetical protein [bacterium endosymbiont of Bathymodiolus sp. 5 South]CAC9464983.1 hypothetical protein [uncultured Gammaproteobacteria bacterium]SHN92393.1 hypothetical protein BCLUESOX_2502 [bacterium endosymbiont of Bathymodiolus sp. 5 South]SSC08553.1 hypothetical protein BTURTLESOX_316 [bacterium endosymbiont of Bathymodiolus sp. 5 South]VVH60225.1 hypothetical protein BSPCLSOX_2686 [uncultured Gammaproteobacteria bacterium]VVH63632.1 hypothetical protein BSPWISOX_1245 [uncultured 
MKKLAILFGLLLSFNVFSDVKDGVAVLNDEPTEKQMQVVRDGAKDRCEDIDDEDKREVCVVDYYAQHNLEEEPSCD